VPSKVYGRAYAKLMRIQLTHSCCLFLLLAPRFILKTGRSSSPLSLPTFGVKAQPFAFFFTSRSLPNRESFRLGDQHLRSAELQRTQRQREGAWSLWGESSPFLPSLQVDVHLASVSPLSLTSFSLLGPLLRKPLLLSVCSTNRARSQNYPVSTPLLTFLA